MANPGGAFSGCHMDPTPHVNIFHGGATASEDEDVIFLR